MILAASSKGSSAPIQKEGTGPLRRANGEERGPKPKGEAGLHKVMEVDGASLVHLAKMGFCKRCHGERRVG